MTSSAYSLGREAADDGSWRRQESQFRRWVADDPAADFPAMAGRYHLYVARACPWAHRTIIARRLLGLEDAIGLSFVDPIRDERGWAFTGGEYVDSINGFTLLSEAYLATDSAYERPSHRARSCGTPSRARSSRTSQPTSCGCSAPCSRRSPRTRSSCIPSRCADEIDALNDRIYDNVNNAVYKAGFSTQQDVYEREVAALFAMLDELDARLRRPALPVRPGAGRDRLAPVHDTGSLRRRLPDPLQVLAAQADRVRAPVAVLARPVPVARRGGDGLLRRDPPPLLPDAPDDQPERAGRGAPGRRLRRAARARVAGLGAHSEIAHASAGSFTPARARSHQPGLVHTSPGSFTPARARSPRRGPVRPGQAPLYANPFAHMQNLTFRSPARDRGRLCMPGMHNLPRPDFRVPNGRFRRSERGAISAAGAGDAPAAASLPRRQRRPAPGCA